jgi:VIT1/CCC1 family predicted Fe2+/Mn2+ transporter
MRHVVRTAMIRLTEQARGRWSVRHRLIARTLGTYGLASLATAAPSVLPIRIGMNRVKALTAATLASFAIFAVVAMAAFHTRSAVRGCCWLFAFALPCDLVVPSMPVG